MDLDEFEQDAVYMEMPAGSILAYNAALWHAGSRNQIDLPRRAIHALFMRPWLRPQWDFRKSLSPENIAGMNEDEKRLFGFYLQASWYDLDTDEQRQFTP
jgi:ectoine hydroxylase-related dioxygenase (phytanoyl-CoA dioxygenase family)